jgi:hypothetical protein
MTDDDASAALNRLNQRLGEQIATVIRAVFDEFGFAHDSAEVGAAVARHLRAIGAEGA